MASGVAPSNATLPCSRWMQRRAQGLDRGHVVTHEQHRALVHAGDVAHLAEAPALELGVTDREHFVDHEDLGLEVRRDREREPHRHPAAVALHRDLEEALDAGEVDDRVELPGDLAALHAQDGAVQVDVLASGELGVESGSDLEQAPDATSDPHLARAGLGDPAQDLEQGALARPVAPDDADRLARLDVEVDVFQRPESLAGARRTGWRSRPISASAAVVGRSSPVTIR